MSRPPRVGRLPSIDVLRAVAIVLMVLVHFVENLSGSYGVDGGPLIGANRYWFMPTGIAAPLFTFLAGLSHRLWADAQRARGRDAESVAKITIRRGLFLMLLGFAFNVLVWTPEDVFNWDILTLIGFSTLVFGVLGRTSATVPLTVAALAIGLAPVLRVVADYPSCWTAGFYEYEFTLSDVVIGFLVTGYFPLFPWLALPMAGYLATPLIYGATAGDVSSEQNAYPRGGMAAAGLLLATAAAVIVVRSWLPVAMASTSPVYGMFPPTTAYVLITLGLGLLAACLLHVRLDGRIGERHRLMRIAEAMSRHSLSLYLLHHVAHLWPLWVWGGLTSDDLTSHWQVAMPVPAAIACAAAFLVVGAWVATRMDRPGGYSAESLLRWLCDP